LAKTMVSKANFLMLDEPTNHLDMHSCDLLIDALNKYEGSLILVSHDRFFISKTANKIWEIVDHEIKEFKGGYEEYVAWKERMAKQETERQKEKSARNKEQGTKNKEQGTRNKEQGEKKNIAPVKLTLHTAINKDVKKELQKQQKHFQQLEEQIAALNTQKAILEASLVDPVTYSDKIKFLQAETILKKATDELDRVNKQYEQVFEKIVELEGKMQDNIQLGK